MNMSTHQICFLPCLSSSCERDRSYSWFPEFSQCWTDLMTEWNIKAIKKEMSCFRLKFPLKQSRSWHVSNWVDEDLHFYTLHQKTFFSTSVLLCIWEFKKNIYIFPSTMWVLLVELVFHARAGAKRLAGPLQRAIKSQASLLVWSDM